MQHGDKQQPGARQRTGHIARSTVDRVSIKVPGMDECCMQAGMLGLRLMHLHSHTTPQRHDEVQV